MHLQDNLRERSSERDRICDMATIGISPRSRRFDTWLRTRASSEHYFDDGAFRRAFDFALASCRSARFEGFGAFGSPFSSAFR